MKNIFKQTSKALFCTKMRFQKRLQAAIHGTPEAPHTLDYKGLKKALRDVDGA